MPVCLPLPENLAENEKYNAKNFVVHGWGATRNYKDISEDQKIVFPDEDLSTRRIGELRLGEEDELRLADGRVGVAASRLPRKVNLDLVDLDKVCMMFLQYFKVYTYLHLFALISKKINFQINEK